MFYYRRKAHYHETDQMGVVHHSNYVKWMEEARIEFLDSIGASYRTIEENGIVSPVVSISLEYKHPVYFDEEVRIGVSILKYNGIRLEVGYEIRNAADDTLCASASSQHCFTKDGRLVSLKREMPEQDAILAGIS